MKKTLILGNDIFISNAGMHYKKPCSKMQTPEAVPVYHEHNGEVIGVAREFNYNEYAGLTCVADIDERFLQDGRPRFLSLEYDTDGIEGFDVLNPKLTGIAVLTNSDPADQNTILPL